MQESELWITRLFNDRLAGFGNSLLGLVRLPAQPRPWADFVVMQILVAILFIVRFRDSPDAALGGTSREVPADLRAGLRIRMGRPRTRWGMRPAATCRFSARFSSSF